MKLAATNRMGGMVYLGIVASMIIALAQMSCSEKDNDGDPLQACAGVTCSGHGTCVIGTSGAECSCDEGYHADGLSCLADSGPCAGVTCSGHGTCVIGTSGAECSCDEGYHADGLSCLANEGEKPSYVPPTPPNATHFNRDYYDKMRAAGRPTQESPWGFQEISLEGLSTHTVSSIAEYQSLVSSQASMVDGSYVWNDGGTHIINFAPGTYELTDPGTYYVMRIPSRTIIQGAGIGRTVFVANEATPLDRPPRQAVLHRKVRRRGDPGSQFPQ